MCPVRSTCWAPACAIVALHLVLVLVATPLLAAQAARLGLGGEEAGARVALCLLTIETVVLALGVPFLVAMSTRLASWRGRALAIGAPLAAVAGIGLAACWLGSRGGVALVRLAWCQVFLLSFAALLVAVASLALSLRLRPTTAQLVATLLALAMVGSIFCANPLIEGTRSPAARTATIQAVLWANPWLIVGGTILDADPVRARRLYSWSVISYYSFRYPASGQGGAARVTAAYAAVSLIVGALAGLLAWLRRRGV